MPEEQWHMSRSFNISFLFGVLVQTATIVWFIASINSSVEENAKQIIRNETRINSLEKVVQDQAVTTARMDENIKAIRQAVEKMANQ